MTRLRIIQMVWCIVDNTTIMPCVKSIDSPTPCGKSLCERMHSHIQEHGVVPITVELEAVSVGM
jgi:hypothetical protein